MYYGTIKCYIGQGISETLDYFCNFSINLKKKNFKVTRNNLSTVKTYCPVRLEILRNANFTQKKSSS